MKKLSETLKENGIAFVYPIKIKNANGNLTYYEKSDGFWRKTEFNADGTETYYENSGDYWWKSERDANGNMTYRESSEGYWYKREYDANGKVTYYEDSKGLKRGTPKSQSCDGKIIEVDGKKYRLNYVDGNSDIIRYEKA